MNQFYTAESVTEGHPDKLCDLIADSVLDDCLSHDALSRVACEVLATKGQVIVAGEITSLHEPQISAIVRSVLRKVGYDPARYAVQCLIHKQSPDIAAGVDCSLEQRRESLRDPVLRLVQYIFSSYLAGHSMDEIATFLNDQEAKYSRKEMTRWYRTSIRYILSNEKYIGDSLLQKTFTPNELPLVNIRNRGQLSQFYVKDSHPAIIPLEMFEAVQRLMKRRAATHTAKPKPGGFPLSHMIKCGFCGSTFQRHLKKEGARWCCYQHRKDKSLCVMEVVAESEVYQTFLLM